LILAVSMAAAGMLLAPTAAGAGERDDYVAAVDRANDLVSRAIQGDPAAARQALQVLQASGHSQPEIEADLQRTPPDLTDAQARLSALSAALNDPARSPNPPLAKSEVGRILSMHRYDAMRSDPSIWDRILEAIGRFLAKILSSLSFGGIPPVWVWVAVVLLLLVLVGIGVWLAQSGWGRARSGVAGHRPDITSQLAIDRFALADRLAAEGDHLGAIRALAGGVAAALGGEGAWEASPLTVRELFSRAPRPDELRPLLRLFEEAVYGARVPPADQYGQAEAIARPFRPRPGRAAA
jgi:hypothetical protein